MATAVVLSEDQAKALEEFLWAIANGEGHVTAGIAAGFTPLQVKQFEADPEIGELIHVAHTQRIEGYEKMLHELAMEKNFPALQMQLYCQAPHRGWRPPQQRVHHEHRGQVEEERVAATTAAVVALIREHGAQALAIGGPLDQAIDTSATDG